MILLKCGSTETTALLVIPAVFKPESSHTGIAGLDSGQKHAGMTSRADFVTQ